MTDDDRRAEIEVVARAWWAHDPAAFDRLTPEWRALQMRRAEAAVEALDRVRDARGDDEVNTDVAVAQIQRAQADAAARSPQGEE